MQNISFSCHQTTENNFFFSFLLEKEERSTNMHISKNLFFFEKQVQVPKQDKQPGLKPQTEGILAPLDSNRGSKTS